MRIFGFLSLLVWALAGCGGGSSKPATTTTSTEPAGPARDGAAPVAPTAVTKQATSPEEEMVVLVEALAADAGEPGNCDRYADAVDRWLGANRSRMLELAEQSESSPSSLSDEQTTDYTERLRTAFQSVVDGAAACGDHKRATAAFEAFDDAMLGS